MSRYRKMMSLSRDTQALLQHLADEKGITANQVVDAAVDWYDRTEAQRGGDRITALEMTPRDPSKSKRLVPMG